MKHPLKMVTILHNKLRKSAKDTAIAKIISEYILVYLSRNLDNDNYYHGKYYIVHACRWFL